MSRVAASQVIATYAPPKDGKDASLIDVKVVVNSDIDSRGNVGSSLTTRYSKSNTKAGDGADEIDYSGEIDQQFTISSGFDNFGNAASQSVYKTWYDTKLDKDKNVIGWTFLEARTVANSGFDIYNQAHSNTIVTYSAADMTLNKDGAADSITVDNKNFKDRQDITIAPNGYDKFGNVKNQTVDTYVIKKGITADPKDLATLEAMARFGPV